MFVITEWFERYEVNASGASAKPDDKLRATRLPYIRSKNHGRAMSPGFKRLRSVAGDRVYEVFGLFQKFLEIAGDEPAGLRGVLRNHRKQPANVDNLAFYLEVDSEKIEFAMRCLTHKDVSWMSEIDDPPEIPGKSGDPIPEIPGTFIEESSRVESNTVQYNTVQNSTEQSKRVEDEISTDQSKESLPENPGKDSTIARASSLSTRLDYSNRLRRHLTPSTPADIKALCNLRDWADKQMDEQVRNRIMEIAADSKGGRNKMAVFFSRVKDELGYRPRAQKDKQKEK